VSLRPVGIDHLVGNQFGRGLDQRGLLLWCQRQEVGSGQCSGRFDADGTNRIAEQWHRCFDKARRHAGKARGAAPLTSGSGSGIAALIAGSEVGEA
jgi:hypothetical protein